IRAGSRSNQASGHSRASGHELAPRGLLVHARPFGVKSLLIRNGTDPQSRQGLGRLVRFLRPAPHPIMAYGDSPRAGPVEASAFEAPCTWAAPGSLVFILGRIVVDAGPPDCRRLAIPVS